MRRRIRRFFFPSPGSSRLRRYGPVTLLVGLPIFLLLVIPPAWEYSNTPGFCGTTCHTMPPEYNTYLVSPHARVPCVDCHIGRDWIAKQALRKSVHMELVFKTITGDYEYPIRVGKMRPARETCERCHFPQKFSDDSLRLIRRFDEDEENTPYEIYLLMHTGGGTAREGLGRGIHWHTENTVEYFATDKTEQEIPWIRVTMADGSIVEYTAEDSSVDVANLDNDDILEMDCITCHNRISHLIPTPRNVVDKALYQSDLPQDMPYIRAQAVDVLTQDYESTDEAKKAIAGLESYYRENHPAYYEENGEQIASAIVLLEQLYEENSYPEQELFWQTHPNNIGHRNSPGCFRCHDGKHFSAAGEAIRLECNLCHSIPQVVRSDEIEPMLPLTTGIEPASHLDSTWISQHHNQISETCANCHSLANAGGTTDTSFCSNSGCHGTDWRYAGFDAPTLATELGIEQEPEEELPPVVEEGEPVTYQTLQPILEQTCGMCHGANPTKGLRVTDYASLMAGSDAGPVIVPGKPDESRVIEVLTAGHFAKLSDEQFDLLRQWIADGAPEGEATTESAPASEEEPTEAAPVEPTPKSEEVTPDVEETAPPEPTTVGPARTPFSWGEPSTATPEDDTGFSWAD